MKGCLKVFVVLVGVGLCVILAAGVALLPGTARPAESPPTATPTVVRLWPQQPTRQPIEQAQPAPVQPTATDTPVEQPTLILPTATDTPASPPTEPPPTATPEPLPTQTPDLQVMIYLGQLERQIGALVDGLSALQELTANAEVNNESWRISVAVQLVAIRNAHLELLALRAPDGWQEVHGLTLAATWKCNDATYLLASGIDAGDASLLQQAGAQVLECGNGLSVAEEAVSEMEP